jgi:tetrahydromethanopterin S-methyltransferase subunit G
MNSMEEKIGYLIAKMEEQGDDIRKVTERFDVLEKEVQGKFKTVESAFRIIKYIAAFVAAVLTLPLNQIKTFLISVWK